MKTILQWKGRMTFESEFDQHRVRMDASEKGGGDNSAPSPKQLVLAGLCGCTAMDVIWILKKMRQEPASLVIDSDAHTTSGEPSVFDTVHLVYRVTGEKVAEAKLKEAVDFSQSKYCGVSAMIAKSAKITYSIELNGKPIGEGEARF